MIKKTRFIRQVMNVHEKHRNVGKHVIVVVVAVDVVAAVVVVVVVMSFDESAAKQAGEDFKRNCSGKNQTKVEGQIFFDESFELI